VFPSYAELHCLTNFSFLRGASHSEELVDRAIELGYSALAITDECSVAGVVRAHTAAKRREKEEKGKIKIIVGAELTLRDEGRGARGKERANPPYPSFFKGGNLQKQIPPAPPFSKGGILGAQFESCNLSNTTTHDENQILPHDAPPPFEKGGMGGISPLFDKRRPQGILRIVLLATSRDGYGHLCELITRGRRQAKKGEYRLTRADLDHGVPGCLALWLPPAHPSLDDALWLGQRFPGTAWIAVELLCGPDDRARLEQLAQLSEDSGLPLVAAGDVHMHVRSRRTLQDTLTAIRLRRPIKECGKALFPSGERHLRPCARLGKIYPPELLIETLALSERCNFSLDELRYEYPEELVPPGETPTTHLRALTEQGLKKRFPNGETEAVRAQVEKELALIAELQYEPFFLTVHDIVQEARRRKILCQGRGSAANSIVCYALEITAAGPVHLNMLFERFISKERNEPPDIDVDFEHERREEIIQYIYQKYGRDRAALAATVITYRRKSALRDVGKALGFDLAQVDRMAKNMAWWDGGRYQAERLRETGLDPDSPVVRRLIELVDTIVDFPRHLSQHVGGFVISRGKLSQLVPTENAAMPERTVIQWEKNDLEELGLLKVDVLALGMLTAIRRAIDLVNAHRGTSIDKDTILASEGQEESRAVYDMICNADTIGVFQIESRAQMSMLPRLRPRRYYDLVIEVAIVRPGPIQGGMVHPYLNRRRTNEAVSYPPRLQPVLERTLGVPIFQEQVIQIAMVAADFTPGEADQLRRAMAAWHRKGGLGPFEEKLKQGMRKNGYSEAFAQQIFEQIKGFGEYGFPESHSASFALLVYVSCWLKCYEPAAFTCALLNSQPMGFYAPAQLVQDARRHSVELRPVDVLVSEWECTLEDACATQGKEKTEEQIPPAPLLQRGEGRRGEDKEHSPCEKQIPPTPLFQRGETSSTLVHQGQWKEHSPLYQKGAGGDLQPAIRLGLCMVKGLSEEAALRLVATRQRLRAAGAFSFEALSHAAGLNRHDMNALAAAGALASIAGHRRQAVWTVTGVEPRPPVLEDAPILDTTPPLLPPSEGQDLVADYASLGLTLGRHPLALLRPQLDRMRISTAAQLKQLPHGKPTRAAGIVIGRQRPGTASGVIFVTLEDETGTVNVVVWNGVAEKQRQALLGSRLLAVHGVLEREGEVVHLIAGRLTDHSWLLGQLVARSRDFH